jgi:hypothetical protein
MMHPVDKAAREEYVKSLEAEVERQKDTIITWVKAAEQLEDEVERLREALKGIVSNPPPMAGDGGIDYEKWHGDLVDIARNALAEEKE